MGGSDSWEELHIIRTITIKSRETKNKYDINHSMVCCSSDKRIVYVIMEHGLKFQQLLI